MGLRAGRAAGLRLESAAGFESRILRRDRAAGRSAAHEPQTHQIFPGADLKFGENLVVNFGVRVVATDGDNRLVYKMRIGYLFGKKK